MNRIKGNPPPICPHCFGKIVAKDIAEDNRHNPLLAVLEPLSVYCPHEYGPEFVAVFIGTIHDELYNVLHSN
jgi:hypothetical protein